MLMMCLAQRAMPHHIHPMLRDVVQERTRNGPGRRRAIRECLIHQGCDMVLESEPSIIRVGHAGHDFIRLARARSAQRSIQPGSAPGRGTWYSSQRISQARAARTSLEETYGTPCALLWLLMLSLMAAS